MLTDSSSFGKFDNQRYQVHREEEWRKKDCGFHGRLY